jgi:ankyrin repeat protein
MAFRKKSTANALLVLADTDEVLENSTVEARMRRMNENFKTDINQPFAIQYTTIHKSAYDGSLSGIQYFLRQRGTLAVYVDTFNVRGMACSHIACERGHSHIIQYLLTNPYTKANVNLKNTIDGSTPLMYACREGHVECVNVLLEHGAKAFDRNRAGLTAMHMAAQGDHLACLQVTFFLFLRVTASRLLTHRYVPPTRG